MAVPAAPQVTSAPQASGPVEAITHHRWVDQKARPNESPPVRAPRHERALLQPTRTAPTASGANQRTVAESKARPSASAAAVDPSTVTAVRIIAESQWRDASY